MRFILPALALAILVTGCVSDEKQRARDMRLDSNRCQNMGFAPGSQQLADCMATASNARQADKDRNFVYNNTPAGPPVVGQPGYVAPTSNDDDPTPMNCKTTESTSTNDDGTTVTRSRQRCSSF